MQKKIIFWRTSDILGQLVLAIVLCGAYVLTSCSNEDNPTSEELFEEAMTAALADAHTYGPQTEAFAQEVATLFNGYVTDINYKTRDFDWKERTIKVKDEERNCEYIFDDEAKEVRTVFLKEGAPIK